MSKPLGYTPILVKNAHAGQGVDTPELCSGFLAFGEVAPELNLHTEVRIWHGMENRLSAVKITGA